MNITFNIPDDQTTIDAIVAIIGSYQETVPNSNPVPAPITDDAGVVTNEAEIQAWQPTIANPQSKSDYFKEYLTRLFKTNIEVMIRQVRMQEIASKDDPFVSNIVVS